MKEDQKISPKHIQVLKAIHDWENNMFLYRFMDPRRILDRNHSNLTANGFVLGSPCAKKRNPRAILTREMRVGPPVPAIVIRATLNAADTASLDVMQLGAELLDRQCITRSTSGGWPIPLILRWRVGKRGRISLEMQPFDHDFSGVWVRAILNHKDILVDDEIVAEFDDPSSPYWRPEGWRLTDVGHWFLCNGASTSEYVRASDLSNGLAVSHDVTVRPQGCGQTSVDAETSAPFVEDCANGSGADGRARNSRKGNAKQPEPARKNWTQAKVNSAIETYLIQNKRQVARAAADIESDPQKGLQKARKLCGRNRLAEILGCHKAMVSKSPEWQTIAAALGLSKKSPVIKTKICLDAALEEQSEKDWLDLEHEQGEEMETENRVQAFRRRGR